MLKLSDLNVYVVVIISFYEIHLYICNLTNEIDMADVHTKDIRSYNMSCIKNKNTKPEMIVRQYLFKKGFRFRINEKRLPGVPDIVLPRYRTIIFVHGCFWHGYSNCRYFTLPKTRTEWWRNKINTNKKRDLDVSLELQQAGWLVLTIWECQLKSANRQETLDNLVANIQFKSF